ncbi:hypothetical protein [Micromonospora mirobrigensis]|uniref:hypothetical protein n=1 Tax=Micromonospora mirobrigensis TaxID=262898 RepID=UPI00114D33B6|nr:hypothetical protein [Micromonospora mirobrigensis]
MTNRLRVLPVAAALLTTLVLAGCGDDSADGSDATWANGSPSPKAAADARTAPAPATKASTRPAPAPSAERTTERRPSSEPKVVLPPRPTDAPAARKVVDAFRAAGLPAANVRNKSVDCGPDGLGLGCSEVVATDAVAVYVFPDRTSASDMADTWGAEAYHKDDVVLNYIGTGTPAAQRKKYDAVLDKLG